MLAISNARHDPVMLYGEDLTKKAETETISYHELVSFLISSRADVNVRDNRGGTPLSIARANGDPDVVGMLQAAGAK